VEAVMFEVELPHPPSVNHYWRRVGAKTLISREGRRFRERVVAILAAQNCQPLTGDLAVEVDVHPPDHRRRDIDNIAKALLDALQHGGAYADDGQVVRLAIARCQVTPGGKAVVRIRCVP
jgi:crossover junction endodeoxyribonuclease RusA